ncbi:MAG: superoxide dismutase, partial [Rhodomicrobium sp.]
MAFQLPELPYAYDALQPYMSAETLQYHHDKHHQAYVDMGNKLLQGSGLEDKSLIDIVKSSYGRNQPLFNNAGQHYNHLHFWKWMKQGGGGDKLPGKLEKKIASDLGGYGAFREAFIEAGKTQFGSGWAWLTLKDGKLEVTKTPNGENPLVHG